MPSALILSIALLAADVPADATPVIRYGAPALLGNLADERIDESSGLATGHRNPGIFFTHNDSGDKPAIYALGPRGERRGAFRVTNARAIDWEDMASFRLDGVDYLLMGDIGDNRHNRPSCVLYLVREPLVPEGEPGAEMTEVRAEQAIEFTYDDGPWDCESLAVDVERRKIYLIKKDALRPAGVYELDLPREQSPPQVARRVATVSINLATGMDISPDNRRAIVVTYGPAYEFHREAGESWGAAFGRSPRKLAMPPRNQGESICYGLDGVTLYLTSEKRPTPLWMVPVAR